MSARFVAVFALVTVIVGVGAVKDLEDVEAQLFKSLDSCLKDFRGEISAAAHFKATSRSRNELWQRSAEAYGKIAVFLGKAAREGNFFRKKCIKDAFTIYRQGYGPLCKNYPLKLYVKQWELILERAAPPPDMSKPKKASSSGINEASSSGTKEDSWNDVKKDSSRRSQSSYSRPTNASDSGRTYFRRTLTIGEQGDPEDVAAELFESLDFYLQDTRGQMSALKSFQAMTGVELWQRTAQAFNVIRCYVEAAFQNGSLPLQLDINKAFQKYHENLKASDDPLRPHIKRWNEMVKRGRRPKNATKDASSSVRNSRRGVDVVSSDANEDSSLYSARYASNRETSQRHRRSSSSDFALA